MSELQPLHTLLEQAGAERDRALAAHQRSLLAAQAAQAQSAQLAGYRRDYVSRFGGQFGRAGAIELLQCYQGFMARLDDAVAQQAQAARQCEARAALLDAELRVASVRKLIERRVAEAGVARERREQKASDEFASRAAWQRLAAGPDALGFGTA